MKSIYAFLILISCSIITVSCGSTRAKHRKQHLAEDLNGTWELNYIAGEKFSFDELYPGKKPTLNFDLRNKKVSGNTSCNSFNGPLNIEANQVNFKEPMPMTRMMCEGAGESTFLETLEKVTAYAITENNTLALMNDDIAIMRFSRK